MSATDTLAPMIPCPYCRKYKRFGRVCDSCGDTKQLADRRAPAQPSQEAMETARNAIRAVMCEMGMPPSDEFEGRYPGQDAVYSALTATHAKAEAERYELRMALEKFMEWHDPVGMRARACRDHKLPDDSANYRAADRCLYCQPPDSRNVTRHDTDCPLELARVALSPPTASAKADSDE